MTSPQASKDDIVLYCMLNDEIMKANQFFFLSVAAEDRPDLSLKITEKMECKMKMTTPLRRKLWN